MVVLAFVYELRRQLADRDQSVVATIAAGHFESILGPQDFAAWGGEPGPDFGVTSAQAVVFSAGGALRVDTNIHSLWTRTAIVKIDGLQPTSFALDAGGPMLGVAGGYLGLLDENGQFTKSIPLGFDGMRVAPSINQGVVYLFGGAGDAYRVYRLIEDGTMQTLLECGEQIVSVADNQTSVFVATANHVMRIQAGTPQVLFTSPSSGFDGPIRSIAATEDGLVLFSTDKKVYALMGPNALSIVTNAGGTLHVLDNVLYVLDPNRKILFSVAPASLQLLHEAANE